MKLKSIIIPLFAGTVIFSACQKKPKTQPAKTSEEVSEKVSEAVDSPSSKVAPIIEKKKVIVTPEQRAEKLGFISRLPKSISCYSSIYNGRKVVEDFLKTDLGKFVVQRMADEDIDIKDLMENEEVMAQMSAYSEEYFTAYGQGSDKALGVALDLYEKIFFYGSKTAVFLGDAYVKEGHDFSPESPKVFLDGPLKGVAKDVIKLLMDFDMPAVYQGAKVTDDDAREALLTQTEEGLRMFEMIFGEIIEPITIKRGEAEFKGYKLDGKKLAAKIDDQAVAQMQEFIEIKDIEAFKKTLSGKSLIYVYGEIDKYFIKFIGKSEEDLVFVEKPADSLCAKEGIEFIDQYLKKDLLITSYTEASVMKEAGSVSSILNHFISAFAKGVQEGLSDADSLGDTQDVEVLLELLQKQALELAGMVETSASSSVFYLEDGIKAEVYGGAHTPLVHSSKPHTLAPLADGKGVFLFANWTTWKEYNQKMLEYVDTFGEAAYLLTKRVAALDIEDGEFKGLQGAVQMFDGNYRSDALNLWQAVTGDLSKGLGEESALVIDLNGVLPKVPQVPSVFLKKGKMPRIAYVSSVDNRSALQTSWEKINTSAESILKKVSNMVGKEIPMQVPMSSEKDDLKTWFVPIPFQNDDFVPSISVSDDLFLASTSKNFSQELAAKFKAGGGSAKKGAWLYVDFKELNKLADNWLELLYGHIDDLELSENARENMVKNRPMIEKMLKSFKMLDTMTMHTRKEAGEQRVSFHLKTK